MLIHVTVTNPVYYDALREYAAAGGEATWTVNRHVRRGHLILLYVCAPVSSLVAVAEAVGAPAPCDDPREAWYGSWMADLEHLRLLDEPVTRAELLAAFPSWRYWKQPRTSVQVPPECAGAMEALLARSAETGAR